MVNESSGNYVVFARLNCPNADDDSFWVKMNDGTFMMLNGPATCRWNLVRLNNFPLKAGEHTLTIAYREDAAMLDKISISNDRCAPQGTGEPAKNVDASR